MTLSSREVILGWATFAVVLLVLTFWLGEPKLQEWRDAREAVAMLERKMMVTQRLLERDADIRTRLADFRKQLPKHPADKRVTAELLKDLSRTARGHSMTLTSSKPEEEKRLEDLYEVAIHCTWEATLESLTRFLYAVQEKGVMMDISQITITPKRGAPDMLRGSFTADFAYSREGMEQANDKQE